MEFREERSPENSYNAVFLTPTPQILRKLSHQRLVEYISTNLMDLVGCCSCLEIKSEPVDPFRYR